MTSANERLVQWLRDAHAMEEQAATMLSRAVERVGQYPMLRDQLARHLEETKNHARLIEGCLQRRGERPSTLKDIAGKTVGMAQALSGVIMSDEVMKIALANYVFEHLEIGSYKILVHAANHAGDSETARVCEGILKEEEAMAGWLDNNLFAVTARYLQEQGAAAMRAAQ